MAFHGKVSPTLNGEINATSTEVIIIGAGPAGLAMGACLGRLSVPFLIFDRAESVGSKWRAHYERLHLHTARRHSALPYLPFPPSYPTYPSRLQFIDYLEAYARRFELEPLFNQRVTAIRQKNGGWETQTQIGSYRSRCVVVATGYNEQPNLPDWPGQASFRGTILHSADYKNGEPFRGKRVLVIGFGNSGGEIAIDLHEHGARVAVSVRSPVNVIFRDTLGIVPTQVLSILMSPLPPPMIDALTAPMIRMRFGDLSRYGLRKLPYGAATQIRTQAQIPVIDVGVISLIKAGQVKVYAGVQQFTEGRIAFTDGTLADFDAVVLATGYRTDLPALFEDGQDLFKTNGYPLHSGEETGRTGLYFCGFRNSATGLLREIGKEARRISASIARQLQSRQ